MMLELKNIYSVLSPAGESAGIIAELFWWMGGGALIIWLIFTTLISYALLRPRKHHPRTTAIFIISGGIIFPVMILSALLYFSLTPLPGLLKKAPEGSLQVEVSAAQWWWRIRYLLKDGSVLELANEIRLPVNEPIQFHLSSVDVIHSFWIPALGGKMDMIPGRKTKLTLRPTQTGIYGGVCAEFCGASHTFMKLKVVVMERPQFEEWLKHQKSPAQSTATTNKGEKLFKSQGCMACHTVKGIGEGGVLGPDLTHVGSRLSLGAGVFYHPSVSSFHTWITQPQRIKPGVKMPAFEMLPQEDRMELATWLKGLK